jgi:drug/metabolite transporter (DMT)-like permease
MKNTYIPLQKQNFKLFVILAFAVVYIVWGSTYYFIHIALQGFQPFTLGAIRFVLAGALMLGYFASKGEDIFDWKLIKQSSVTGILLLFVDTGIIIWVEQFMSSGLVAIMAASAAIWFVVLDKPKWKENFRSIPIIAGLFLGFLGVVMLFGEQVAIATDPAQKATNLWGMGLLILGAIAWTAGSLYSKYTQKETEPTSTKSNHSMVGIGWQILLAGLAFIVAATVRGEWSQLQINEVPAKAWGAIAYLVIFGSILAYSSYIWLLKVRPATEVSTYAYVNPIVAVALSLLLTDEGISSVQITGLLIILLSVFLMNWDAYMGDKNKNPFSWKRSARAGNSNELKASIKVNESTFPLTNPEKTRTDI